MEFYKLILYHRLLRIGSRYPWGTLNLKNRRWFIISAVFIHGRMLQRREHVQMFDKQPSNCHIFYVTRTVFTSHGDVKKVTQSFFLKFSFSRSLLNRMSALTFASAVSVSMLLEQREANTIKHLGLTVKKRFMLFKMVLYRFHWNFDSPKINFTISGAN